MTPREKDVFSYCMSYYLDNGLMPSTRMIGKELYISHVTASRHMKSLEQQGLVRYIAKNQRPVPSLRPYKQVAL